MGVDYPEGLTSLTRTGRRHSARLGGLVLLSICLALLTAAYGGLAGPLLRALFGGAHLTWPASVSGFLPEPPSVTTLRTWLPWLILGVAVLKACVQHVHAVGVVSLGERVKRDLRERIHRRVMAWSPDAIHSQGVADVISRATHDVEWVSRYVTEGLIVAIRDGLQVVALVALCFAIDWRLALAAFCVYPLAFYPVVALGRRLRGVSGEAQAQHGVVLAQLDDHLRRAELYQLSGASEHAEHNFVAANEALEAAIVRTERVKAVASPLMEVFGAAALAAGVMYTISRVHDASLAPELVMSFLAALLMLYQPVKKLARLQGVLEPARAALSRLRLFFEESERLPKGGGDTPPRFPDLIEIRQISRQRGSRPVLDGLSAVFRRGEITALCGPNGAGKTTLAWLLSGLLLPDSGDILIDGKPLNSLRLDAWRRQIGWMTQDPLLGAGTLRQNVCFGVTPSDDDLAWAARISGVEAIVDRVPGGWDSLLGEQGAGLSGGEQQRVALCRALVRRPQLLILDEPTAHLDKQSARYFIEQVAHVKSECIVLLITHNAECARLADQTVLLGASPLNERLAG